MIIKKTLSKLKGLKYRFDLLEECDRLKKIGKSLPKNYKKLIFIPLFYKIMENQC